MPNRLIHCFLLEVAGIAWKQFLDPSEEYEMNYQSVACASLLTALLVVPTIVQAEILAVCGVSNGHAFYLPGPLVPEKEAGWTEDAISGGSFQLIRSGADYDIISTDATGRTLSARGDGGEIVAFKSSRGDLIVTILYPLAIETYAFWFGSSGPMIATFSQVKHSTPITKHAVFKSNCQKPKSTR